MNKEQLNENIFLKWLLNRRLDSKNITIVGTSTHPQYYNIKIIKDWYFKLYIYKPCKSF